jgi:2,3-bisphosphoglycerate-dependent phosphoglycerate mutase
MICRLFVFRHAETFDNQRGLFSGWRDSELTPEGAFQAQKISKQLKGFRIDYAFTSHLKRAKQTLEIVLQAHPQAPVFVDDRIIERCYGLLQGRNKKIFASEDPEYYERIHRGYSSDPPEGESLEKVERRVMSFLAQLEEWLKQNPGNVAISCHNNSIRPFRRVFEALSLAQMCNLDSPQDHALIYDLDLGNLDLRCQRQKASVAWEGLKLAKQVKLATAFQNPLKKYY